MRRLHFEDYEDFTCELMDKIDSLEDDDNISVIAKYEDVKEIIKELLYCNYDIVSIDLKSDELGDYCDEYVVGIDSYGFWCEKFKRDNEYINNYASVTYIMDNCSSKVISHCNSDIICEVSVGEDCNEDDIKYECTNLGDDNNTSESIYVSRSKDGTPLGFSKSWCSNKDDITCYSSYSHYSDDIDVLRYIAKEFDVRL